MIAPVVHDQRDRTTLIRQSRAVIAAAPSTATNSGAIQMARGMTSKNARRDMSDIYAENHQNDPDNKPTPAAAKLLPFDIIVWQELKQICAADPDKAMRLVMVSEDNIRLAYDRALQQWNTRPQPAPPEGEPVAWAVKDFADGWVIYSDEKTARLAAEEFDAAIVRLGLSARPKVEDAEVEKS